MHLMNGRVVNIVVGVVVTAVIVISETRPTRKEADELQISDIFGLQQALNIRPVIGTGFNMSAAAVIDATGAINAAIGNASDCVLVDGLSAACGASTQVSVTSVDGEIPMGIMNGINSSFTLANVPNPPTSVHLYRNGIRLTQAIDYTLNGAVMSFIGTDIPNATDSILADYRY